MKAIKKYFLIGIVLLIFSTGSFAQKFSASADLQLAIPQSDYKLVNPNIGYGLRANFLYKPGKDIPIKFGIELGMQEKERVNQYFRGNIGGFTDEFKVSASSNIFSLMVVTRFEPVQIRKVKPFIDLSAGWNVFYSTVEVQRLTYFSDYNDSYANSTKAHWALTYGATGGVDIPLNKKGDIGLELKLSYFIGNHSKYLTNPYIDEHAEVSFMTENSRTNMLIPQAGVRFSF
jgi:hypothetical protein